MLRKVGCFILLVLLFVVPALAEESPEDEFFARGKQAVSLLSYGEYKRAYETIGFDFLDAKAYTEAEFQRYIEENFTTLFTGTVQQDVAVCYGVKEDWTLAVPIEAPRTGRVETLILKSKDFKTFYAFGMLRWEDVQREIDEAEEVYWNEEYREGKPAIEPDVG